MTRVTTDLRSVGRMAARSALLLVMACGSADTHHEAVEHVGGWDTLKVIELDTVSGRCDMCRIVLTPVAHLTSSLSANFFFSTRVTFLPSIGHFFAAPLLETGRVAEYDGAGRLLGLRLSEGDGPGEMRRIRFLRPDTADGLIVIGSDFRIVRLDVATGHTTSSRLPSGIVPEDVLSLPGGALAIDNNYPTHPRLVILESDMSVRASTGAVPEQRGADANPDKARLLPAWLGRDNDGGFWECTKRYNIRLNHWSANAQLLDALVESPAWFIPYTPHDEERRGRGLLASQAKPFPAITACYEDSDGLLWVIASAPDLDYQATDPVEPDEPLITVPQSGIPTLVYRDWSRYTDAVVQVIDPKHRTVVATARFPQSIPLTMGENLVDQITPTKEGDFVHQIFRLELVRPAGGRTDLRGRSKLSRSTAAWSRR